MSDNVWTVPAQVLDVVSGDTIVLRLALGWHITLESRCRLIGIHVPGDDGEARRWIVNKIGFGGPESVAGWLVDVTFVSHELDANGRSRGQVLVTTPQGESFDLGLTLIDAGLAVPSAV